MKFDSMNARQAVSALKNVCRYEHDLFLDFSGISFRVASNAGALIRFLESYFRDFVIPENDNPVTFEVFAFDDPDFSFAPPEGLTFKPVNRELPEKRVKESFLQLDGVRVVRKNKTGMFMFFDVNHQIVAGPCVLNSNQVVNFINSLFIRYHLNRNGLLLHAAGIVYNGNGMAIAGFSGAGKSTLALHIMNLNPAVCFVSNDRIVAAMQGVAKMPRINPGTIINNESLCYILDPEKINAYNAMPPEALWHLEEKYDAFIDEAFGKNRFALGAPFTSLVILNWKKGGGPVSVSKVNLSQKQSLLPAVMKSPGIFFMDEGKGGFLRHTQENYLDFFNAVDVYEIRGGYDFENGAEICMDILNR